MAKAKLSLCKTNDSKKTEKNKKKKKKQFDFSESEIDVAEQLIQLSGDSDNNNNNETDSNHEDTISDGDTIHVIINFTSKQNIKDFFDEGGDGFDSRRKKRFKSLSEIYSLTNKPLFFCQT